MAAIDEELSHEIEEILAAGFSDDEATDRITDLVHRRVAAALDGLAVGLSMNGQGAINLARRALLGEVPTEAKENET